MENKRGISKIFNKNHKLFLIISIFAIITLVTGTSYAILKGTITSDKEHIIKTGKVTLELTEYYDSISQNIVIYKDTDGLLQNTTYDFNLKNIGSDAARYDVKLINEATGTTKLPDSYIKVGLEINGVEYGPMSLTNVNNIIDSGIISQNEIISYKMRLWLDREKESEITALEGYTASFKIEVEAEQRINTLDTSGANEPKLSENMIPVYYDETASTWKKADEDNLDPNYQWYNYSEKMWANAVTVSETNRATYLSAKPGTAISMDDINTMLVWIPRYKYKVWNYNLDGTVTSNPQEIYITFENGTKTTGDITCFDNIQGTSDGTNTGTQPTTSEICKLDNKECTDNACNGKTYTHPAFTFGNNELTGFWVGKFEVSSDITCTAEDSSAIGAGCNLTTIRPLIKPNVTSWRGTMISVFENNMMAMNDSNNKYGFALTDDTHMIKNSEWGAIAYLSHSKYGKNSEIEMNSVSTYTTGCGPQSEGSTSSGTSCNAYNTALGQSASTTGNIYGVYDMSGGAYDYVMGNIVSPDGTIMMSGQRANTSYPNNHSGYDGILYYNGTTSAGYGTYDGTYSYPENKYIDKYSYNKSATTRSRSKLGDGIREVLNTSSYVWYSDTSRLAYSYFPWFLRGGYPNNGSNAGVFFSHHNSGNAHTYNSSRLVISQ